MTNLDTIRNKIEKLTNEFGGFENIALTREAYHNCNPNNPNQWACDAVRINGTELEVAKVYWNHDEELEDAADYNWEFGQSDFGGSIEVYDLTDDYDNIYLINNVL